jgi:hypothetical protein
MTRPGASARPCGLLSLNPYSSPGLSMFSNSGSVSYRFWRRLRANNAQRSLLTVLRTTGRSDDDRVAGGAVSDADRRQDAGVLQDKRGRLTAKPSFQRDPSPRKRESTTEVAQGVFTSISQAECEKWRGTGVGSRFTRPVHAVLETVYQSLPGGFDDVLGDPYGAPHPLAVRRVD